jgi:transposase-like protein
MLADAEEDVLAFSSFAQANWSELRSTNPLERFNEEIGRRTHAVGISPTTARGSASWACSAASRTTSGSSDVPSAPHAGVSLSLGSLSVTGPR